MRLLRLNETGLPHICRYSDGKGGINAFSGKANLHCFGVNADIYSGVDEESIQNIPSSCMNTSPAEADVILRTFSTASTVICKRMDTADMMF